MATLDDNIKTIRTAIYGKEMRPAIADALTQSWAKVEAMVASVDRLSERLDTIGTGGGDGDTDSPSATGVLDYPSLIVGGRASVGSISGIPAVT